MTIYPMKDVLRPLSPDERKFRKGSLNSKGDYIGDGMVIEAGQIWILSQRSGAAEKLGWRVVRDYGAMVFMERGPPPQV